MCTSGCGQKVWQNLRKAQGPRRRLCPEKPCKPICRKNIIVKTTRLQSSVKENAKRFYKCFINPWGLAIQKTKECRTIWIAVNQTNEILSFDLAGNSAFESISTGNMFPTGLVLNTACQGFPITNVDDSSKTGSSFLIVAGENGTIAGFNPNVDCEKVVTAVSRVGVQFPTYKGLALRQYLYATNFATGFVEYYNAQWTFINQFADSNMADIGLFPFNVAIIKTPLVACTCKVTMWNKKDNLNEQCCSCSPGEKSVERVFVSAASKTTFQTVVAGTGLGGISVFTLDGQFLYTFYSGGPLNAPWGMTTFNNGKNLAVSNFGDGRINLFDLCSRKWIGSFENCNGHKVVIDGIWSLAKSDGKLFFTAGIDSEKAGLLGYFT